MRRNMIGLITFDLVLRIVTAGMMGVTLKIKIRSMNFNDPARHKAGLGIPSYMITYFKLRSHDLFTGFFLPLLFF